MRKFYQFLGLFVTLLTTNLAIGQVSGIKTIPGDYATIAAAVADLNTNGIGAGGVTINIAAGHVESLASTIVLTATGTSGNEIIFQKSGTGANPILMAYAGTNLANAATQDGMFALDGADFVTIDGIDLSDTNTVALAMMEYGYGLFKASATNGCQNVTIKNCTITLNRNNFASGAGARVEGSVGIASLSSTRIATAAVSVTAATGTNSNNKFYSNTIQNCNYGIFVVGFAASTPFTNGDTNNDIGGTSSATGNTIINFGGGTGSSNSSAAIRSANQWGLNVSNNVINNNNGSGVNHPSTLRGIYLSAATSASVNCNFNTVTVKGGGTTSAVYAIDVQFGSTAASNTINVNDNIVENCTYTTATSGTLFGIYTSTSAQTVNINNNIVRNSTINASTGTFYGINYNGATPNQYVLNNQVYGLSRSGAGTLYGIYSGSSAINEFVNGNTVYDITNSNTSTAASVVRGIYQLTAAGNKEFKNNTIYNLSIQSTNTTTSAIVEGLRVNYGTTDDISGNTIYGISGTGVLVAGIACAGTTAGCTYSIYKNKIYNIVTTNSSGSTIISGINVAGQNSNIYNNLISDLNATNASSTDAIRGINLTGTTANSTHNVTHNTVLLNASSTGTNFGSSGIFHSTSATATTAALNLRNNIIINNSTSLGTGLTVAYRRSSTALANYASTSDKNIFYAGTPSLSNLIMFNGTNAYQTLGAFQGIVAPREGLSFSENTAFMSTIGSNANFLKPTAGQQSYAESLGNVTSILDDFGNIGIRGTYPQAGQLNGGGTAPDMGAWEFDGTPYPTCTTGPTSISIDGLSAVCSGTGTSLSVLGIPTGIVGYTYQWLVSDTSNAVVYSNLGTGSQQLTGNITVAKYYKISVGCLFGGAPTLSTEKSVMINALPIITVTPSTDSICIPNTIPTLLTAGGALTYTWSPVLGLDTTIGASVNANPNLSTTYTVSGTDANGCVNNATALISVFYKPTLQPVANPSNVCLGSSAQLSVNDDIEGALLITEVTVFRTGTGPTNPYPAHITGADLVEISNISNISLDLGGYRVSAFGNNSANPSHTFTFPNGTIIPAQSTVVICLGTGTDNPSLLYFNTGGTNDSYSSSSQIGVVLYNGVRVIDAVGLGGSLSGSYTFNTSTGVTSADFSGFAPNASGLAGSRRVQAIDNNTGANWLQSGASNVQTIGTFDAIYTLPPSNRTYLWTPSANLSSDTIQNPIALNIQATTTYNILITSLNGCSSSGSVAVSITPLGTPNLSFSINDTACANTLQTLTAAVTGGGEPYQYAWNTGDTTASINISPMSNTNYTVWVYDNCGDSVVASTSIFVNPLPVVAISSLDTAICFPNETTSLTASGALTYAWSPSLGLSDNDTAIVTASPSTTTNYTVIGTDINGCQNSASKTVVSNPGIVGLDAISTAVCGLVDSTSLSSAGNSQISTILSENFNAAPAGWTVNTTSSGGTNPAAGAWQLYLSGATIASNDNSIYAMVNSDAQGNGGTTNTILTSPPVSTVGLSNLTLNFYHRYRIYSADVAVVLEASSDNSNWTVIQNYTGTDQGTDLNFALANINLNAFANLPEVRFRFRYQSAWGYYWAIDNVSLTTQLPITYSWSSIPSGFSSTNQNPGAVAITAPTQFIVTASNASGCSFSDTTNVQINPVPAAVSSVSGDLICPGSTASISAVGVSDINWFTDAVGGMSIATSDTFTTPTLSTNTDYYVSDINSFGCEGPRTMVSVTMKDSVDISMDPQTTDFCELSAQSLSVTATGTNLTYQWQKNSVDITGETSSTLNFASVALTDAGDYSVVITSDCDVKTSAIATVTVTPAIIADVLLSSSSTSVCGGAAITFTATPVNGGAAPMYQWYKNGQMVSGATNAVYVLNSPLENDSVYVQMTSNASPCLFNPVVNSSAVVLTNSTVIPTVAINTTSSTACIGSAMVFTSTASNTGNAPIYNWMINGNSVGASGSSFSTTVLQNGDVVSLMMTSNAACTSNPIANSNSISVTINNNTVIITQPVSSVNCAGTSATFTTDATGTGTLAYQWMKNGNAITGATNSSLTLSNVASADAGSYSVSATGTCGTVMSNIASLTVNPLTVISNQPSSATQCAGSVALFNVSASGTGTLTYQWKKGGVDITGAVSNVLVLNNITAADAGSYTVEVTGACGAVTSSAATLTVNPLTAITTQPISATQCAGTNATLTVAASGAGTLTYQWMKNGSAITGATSASLALNNLTAADAGSYMVMVTGTCGSVNSNPASIMVNALTAISTQPSAVATCAGSNATLSVNATGSGTLTYQWKKGGVNVTGATSSSLTFNGISAADAGSYTVEITGTCGTVTSSAAVVTVNALTAITAQPSSLTQCAGTNANFSVTATGSGTLTYQWMKNGAAITGATASALALTNITAADAAVYSVNVTGTCGSTMSINATLNVNPLTAISAQPISITQCAGTNAILSVGANGAGVLTYQWKKGGVNIAGAVGSSLLLNNIDATAAGSYTVEVTGACGVVTSSAATITVNELTAISVQPVSASQCEGTDISMSVTASGSGTLTYQWRNNGIAIPGATNSSYTITGAALSNTGNYSVSVTGTCGTVNSNNAVVNINPLPVASFTNNAACEGSATMFMNTSTISSGFIAAYHWDLGNGTTNNSANTSVVYDTAGTYMVHLIATSINGCTDTITEMVVVNALPTVTVTADLAVCKGESATLTAGGADTYSWMPSNTLTSNTGAVVTATPNATTTYMVMGVDTNGCSNSASVTVTVNAYPVVDLGGDRNLCINNTATLDAGNTGATYVWSTGATTQTISIDGAVLGLGFASFSVDVTANGCTTSDAISVFVDPCTSVDEKENATNVEVYPNPTRGNTTIILSNVADSKVSINIINSTGTIILTEQLEVMNGEFVKAIDFSKYAQGLYFLQVNSGNSNILKKIVVQ